MAWGRGAWEKTTSGVATYENRDSNNGLSNEKTKNKTKLDKQKNRPVSINKNKKSKVNEKLKNQEIIKQRMNEIIKLMINGNSIKSSCEILNLDYTIVKEWYDKGWRGDSFYKDFYERTRWMNYKFKELENKNKTRNKRKDKTKSSKTKKSSHTKKQKIKRTDVNVHIKMNQIINLMKNGKSRSDAAREVGVPIYKVNTWYTKGKNGNEKLYKDFYRNILEIWKKA